MSRSDFLQIAIYALTLLALAPILGEFMARVFEGRRTFLSPLLGPVERAIYAATGADPTTEMSWVQYATALLAFNAVGFLGLVAILGAQSFLPMNPQSFGTPSWHLIFNVAASFVTNTNWQSYSGETALSYFTQMAGLGVQNFLSAATGLGAFLAMARGAARSSSRTVGNFWADLVRSIVYVLLPLSLLVSALLVSEGVVQTFSGYVEAQTLEGAKQSIPLGPAASQIAIKQIGTNGGGFFNANSAHPLENPTPLSNFVEMLLLLLLPAALTFVYGRIAGSPAQGWTLLAAMTAVWLALLAGSLWAEAGAPFAMEGKELRFGVAPSLVWSTATTAASNGSVNAMHSSLSPLAGGLALFGILLGEVIFGGVGSGLYGMLLFVVLTVFLCGLMIGRSPEWLGKKIEAFEVKMAILGVLGPCVLILLGSVVVVSLPEGVSSLSTKGPHGFTEALYAVASAVGNNGSAFAGLSANTPFWNVLLGLLMLAGRFVVLLPALAVGGSLAVKRSTPPSSGTFPSSGWTFGALLVGVIAIVGALTFLPALFLGPIAEHLLMISGVSP